jgi:hypothetical protein
MSDLLSPDRYPKCSEFYIVEKAVIVVTKIGGFDRQLRIEALRRPGHPREYSTRGYILESVILQQSDIKDGKYEHKPQMMDVWVEYNVPWTDRDSADAAIAQALSLLNLG